MAVLKNNPVEYISVVTEMKDGTQESFTISGSSALEGQCTVYRHVNDVWDYSAVVPEPKKVNGKQVRRAVTTIIIDYIEE